MKTVLKVVGGLVALSVFALALNQTPLVWRNIGIVQVAPTTPNSSQGQGTIDSTPARVYSMGGGGALIAFQKHLATGEIRIVTLALFVDTLATISGWAVVDSFGLEHMQAEVSSHGYLLNERPLWADAPSDVAVSIRDNLPMLGGYYVRNAPPAWYTFTAAKLDSAGMLD